MFVFLLVMNFLISVAMIIFGVLWKSHPPKSINWAYGYRTSMSMKNNEIWKFVHAYNAKIWRWVGISWLIISIAVMFLFKDNYEVISIWITFIGSAIMILSLIPKYQLKWHFEKDLLRTGNLR